MQGLLDWVGGIWTNLPELLAQDLLLGLISSLLIAFFVTMARWVSLAIGNARTSSISFFESLKQLVVPKKFGVFQSIWWLLKTVVIFAYFVAVYGIPMSILVGCIAAILAGESFAAILASESEVIGIAEWLIGGVIVLPVMLSLSVRRLVGWIGHFLISPIIIAVGTFGAFLVGGTIIGFLAAFIISLTSEHTFMELANSIVCVHNNCEIIVPDTTGTAANLGGFLGGSVGLYFLFRLWFRIIPRKMGFVQRPY